jgi:2-keto-4-pentenoate hydratase
MSTDAHDLAQALAAAYAAGQPLPAMLSSRDGFDLDAAYAVQGEFVRLRRAEGHRTVGRKVGYANRAVWRALKLETLVWAHMYDDTVQYADHNQATLIPRPMSAPKIEPEIVFKIRTPIAAGDTGDAAAVLGHVEWLALGFEIIDCPFPDWKFQPPDFVAAYGLHRALVVGEPRAVEPLMAATLAEQLPAFKVRLLKNGTQVDEGSGRNVLRSPALCLGELAAAIARRTPDEPLASGELVSTGTITTSQLMTPGETWRAELEGLDLPALTLRT